MPAPGGAARPRRAAPSGCSAGSTPPIPTPRTRSIDDVRPDLVLNAVGIVKQRADAKAAIPSIAVNSLWPHVLADACERRGARMVHVSTDCVFSGSRGGYVESDVPDAFDLYGRSKLLGEVTDRENTVTLRTSIIGWQLGEPTGLVGWFAAHRDEPLKGFTKAVFSGLTTRALTEVDPRRRHARRRRSSGLWHVSAEPIDKYTLLTKLAEQLGLGRRHHAVGRAGHRPLARQHAVPRAHRLDAAELGRDAGGAGGNTRVAVPRKRQNARDAERAHRRRTLSDSLLRASELARLHILRSRRTAVREGQGLVRELLVAGPVDRPVLDRVDAALPDIEAGCRDDHPSRRAGSRSRQARIRRHRTRRA